MAVKRKTNKTRKNNERKVEYFSSFAYFFIGLFFCPHSFLQIIIIILVSLVVGYLTFLKDYLEMF